MQFVLVIWVLLLVGCSGGGGADPVVFEAELGGPNPGIPANRLAAFHRGKAVFERRFTRSEGHGPDFNTNSCVSCHEIPVVGGSSPRYRNFFIARNAGGTNFFEGDQLVARTFSYTRAMRESMIGAATVAQRNAPPMFGVGAFERIPDADITANADPFDTDGDGISGRENRDGSSVGRFGFKAQEARLEDFIRGPLFNHMGITSNPLSFGPGLAQVSAPDSPTTDDDGKRDPELPHADVLDLFVFLAELAEPEPLPMDPIAARGEVIFGSIGCAKCHIRNIVTAGAPVNAYTDLLLHDMGPELADGVAMGFASGSEFRTQPLWGLRLHAPYLHDGRADKIADAIDLHGGEATLARNAFRVLGASDRAALLRFLETR